MTMPGARIQSAARRAAPWIAASAAVSALYVAVALAVNGRFALPLDDSYIFLQYAREAAHGRFLQYGPGSGASSGATSPLYLLVLAALYLVGLRGPVFPFVPLILGVAGLAVSAAAARRIASRAWGAPAGRLAAALVLLHGPLAWHFLGGMEAPLVVPLLLLTVEAFQERRALRFALVGSLLALSRPEGWIIALALTTWALVQRILPRGALALAPAAAGVLPLLINLAASGRLQSNSFITKSPLEWGVFYAPEHLLQSLRFFLATVRDLFANLAPNIPATWAANDGSAAALFFAPGAAVLAIAAIAAAPAAAAPVAVAFGAHVALVSFVLPVHMHWERYLVPAFPLFLVLVAGGAAVIAERWGRSAWRAAASYLLAFQAVTFVAFALAYAASVHDLAFMHVPLGRWIDANLPREARVAANDVGAIAYYGRRPIFDLEGLTTDAMTRPARNGSASVYEAIEAMPAASRPTHMCVFPSWFDEAFTAPHAPVYLLRLFQVTIAASNPMVLYRADWSLAGTGDAPRSAEALAAIAGLTLADRLDVADLASEASHAYALRAVEGGYEPRLRSMTPPGAAAPVMDGGRLVTGSERFVLRARPGRDAVLVVRTDGAMRAEVRVDGRRAAAVQSVRRQDEGWSEEAVRLPASAIARAEIDVEIATESPHYLGYGSYHYWLYQ